MYRCFKALFTCLLILPLCSSSQKIDSLHFINCYHFYPADNKNFGGISGIETTSGNEFFALSDRSGLFKCGITYSAKGIDEIKLIKEYTELNAALQGDYESVRILGRQLAISDEESRLLLINRDMKLAGSTPYPDSYTAHFQSNKGIEAVAIHGNHIWICNEKPLKGDGAFLRLSLLDTMGHILKQYLYPYNKGEEGEDGHCVTEILYNDAHSFITLERTFSRSGRYNVIRLWYVDISGADDVNKTGNTSSAKQVTKKCIAMLGKDFECTPGAINKNLEAVAWLGNRKYLLVVCDNNFLVPETDFYLFSVH